MKSSRYQKWIIGAVFILFLLLCSFAEIVNKVFDPFADFVNRYPDPVLADASETGEFQIDPETILASLSNDESEVFSPLLAEPYTVFEENKILWQQSDYLNVASAAFKFQWKESSNDWKVYRMFFFTDCQDQSSGFYYAAFTYYKEVWNNLALRYVTRQIDIFPQYHQVTWSGDAYYYPPIPMWKNIDIENLKFSAEQVVDIAEKYGGEISRLAVSNKCEIDLILYGGNNWHVFYEGDDSPASIFEIDINPYTGRVYQK